MNPRCRRCRGLMVWEKFYDKSDSHYAWRCTVCGEVVDELIESHRKSFLEEASRFVINPLITKRNTA